jgi:hypothetical protein
MRQSSILISDTSQWVNVTCQFNIYQIHSKQIGNYYL